MSDAAEQQLAKAYHASTRETLVKTYDQWADQYDADMQGIGYIHPAVMAGLVARCVLDAKAAILDAGVGTGTIGHLLHILGYSNLLGVDMSAGMLAKARARGIFADLRQGVLGETLDFETASMQAIVSSGTFTLGHAPASSFDELTRILQPGGHLIFTVGCVVWHEAGFAAKLAELVKAGVLSPIASTAPYYTMPLSKTEGNFQAQAHIYQRT
ncbi:MAG: class I SAM-dependent methyltransferase [Alphaproteobacteria bacterium]|nr:class I SAM-dependent methyltransferase [Alphaproteobacteria bacterium]